MKNVPKSLRFGALPSIVALLLLSGALRLGGVGLAVANETEDGGALTPEAMVQPKPLDPDTATLLAAIAERTTALDQKERELAKRAEDLNAAQVLIDQNLARMIEAEEKLAQTIARVDGASEGDIDRLTAVYESMKPKVAAALFEQMTPEFAAGFLGRMNPDAAAGILSGLSSETGYAISVVLAGRNAKAPTE
jgi:flagellar motility protein MotE (MotC chaperone)